MDFKKEIEEMRGRYRKNPLKPMKLPRPSWLDEKDGLRFIYTEQDLLLSQGIICYGSIVQANTILFKSFPPFNCPATLVYSENSEIEENPYILHDIANEIFSYKDMPSDEVPIELRELVRVITDELDRSAFRGTLSDADGNKINIGFTSLMIFRKHLPKKKICGSMLPLIVAPEKCNSIIVLPEEYWSENFKQAWINGMI